MSSRVRQELRDLLELVLLPSCAAILPWAWAFRLFQRMARWSWLYRDATEKALNQAKRRGWAFDENHWLWTRRLVTLVDHADLYLSLTRNDDWMRHHMTVIGAWPQDKKAYLICTFHWGAGMWALRNAATAGLRPHALVAGLTGDHFRGRSVLSWYAKIRTRAVASALTCSTLDVSASLRPVVRALRAREPVLAAIDAPADQAEASEQIVMLGMRARVPKALLRLAAEKQIPVVIYTTGLDTRTGHRNLRILKLDANDDPQLLTRLVFGELEAVIQEDAPAWHFWGESDRIFV